jgi:hypothetical protein
MLISRLGVAIVSKRKNFFAPHKERRHTNFAGSKGSARFLNGLIHHLIIFSGGLTYHLSKLFLSNITILATIA